MSSTFDMNSSFMYTDFFFEQINSSFMTHNESTNALGIAHNVTLPLWSGVAIGIAFTCMAVGCLCAVCFQCSGRQNNKRQVYERMPLITF
jgi:hypothetical protein